MRRRKVFLVDEDLIFLNENHNEEKEEQTNRTASKGEEASRKELEESLMTAVLLLGPLLPPFVKLLSPVSRKRESGGRKRESRSGGNDSRRRQRDSEKRGEGKCVPRDRKPVFG